MKKSITPMIIEATIDIGGLLVCIFLLMAIIALGMSCGEAYDKSRQHYMEDGDEG